uniref:7TM_GPCR_Srx domain-containing protein n=1 Tax=Parastrongyloides trichosuri TaxID=131310 RepID=A0A0N4ZK14_PARTI
MALCNIIALAHFQKLKINLNNQWNEEKEDKTSINYRFQLIENFKTFYVVQGINFGVSLVDLSAIPIFLIADGKLIEFTTAILFFDLAVAIVTFILTIFFGSTNTQMLRKVFCRNIKTKMIQTSIKENNDNETNIHFAQMKLAWEKLK